MVGYTPRGHRNVTLEVLEELGSLGFVDERMQKLGSISRASGSEASNIFTCGSSKLEAGCNNNIPELPPAEGDQGFSEDDVVQGVMNDVQGTQDVWDVGLQGLGASSLQRPDDDDEGYRVKKLMAFEAVVEEVIDLTAPPERPGHALKDFEVRGLRRPHRKVAADQISKGVLSIDLAGPYTTAYDGSKYALVAVFRVDENLQLHFMRPMKRRLWTEMFESLQSILAQMSAICGERPQVVRVHSDKAREFLAQKVVEGINSMGIFKTTTTGYDPQANGLAERTVGLLKERARGFLIRGGVDKKFWPLMMAEAARRQRDLALHRPHQGKLPEPGDHVAVTVQGAGPFDPKVEPGRFIAQSDTAAQGALVLVHRVVRSTWSLHVCQL